jgi:hypothetical protein
MRRKPRWDARLLRAHHGAAHPKARVGAAAEVGYRGSSRTVVGAISSRIINSMAEESPYFFP